MKLTKEDIAFICEQRTQGIRFKTLAIVFGQSANQLRLKLNYALQRGFK